MVHPGKIYTIGHTDSYNKGLSEMGSGFKKLGKCRLESGENYEGGSVWRNFADANEHLARYSERLSDYSVYGVIACWDSDTVQLSNEPYRRLLKTSQIVSL